MRLFKKNNNTNDTSDTQNNAEDISNLATDVLKTVVVNAKDVEAEVPSNGTDAVGETEEALEDTTTQTTNVTNITEVKMNEVNVKYIMARVQAFLSGNTQEDIIATDVPVGENGEEMTQENTTELEKVQEELKLAQDKASEFETAKSEIELKAQELQTKIDTMNAEKLEESIKAVKAELSQMVEKEISFVGGTIEDNVEKLFELKSTLGDDKAELFTFVVDSLKAKSAIIEDSLNEDGLNPEKTTQTVEEKVDQLTKEKMEEKKISEATAYNEVLNENPELKKAIYENIK